MLGTKTQLLASHKVPRTLSFFQHSNATQPSRLLTERCALPISVKLEGALCFLKVCSAQCLNWSIVTRAHVPRQFLGGAADAMAAKPTAAPGSKARHGMAPAALPIDKAAHSELADKLMRIQKLTP